jgi:hypothetical protein
MSLIARCFTVLICLFPCWLNAQLSLTLSERQITVDPETLAVAVSGKEAAKVVLSAGGERHRVSQLNHQDDSADWLWDEGRYRINLRAVGNDIVITVQAEQPGSLTLLSQSGDELGMAISLPLAEGHYIPTDDGVWQRFLADEMHQINTAQDLSLPLWTNDYGEFSASWLLLNPFNNQLRFNLTEHQRLMLTLSHQFTRLSPQQPMILMLTLSERDPLAGAKRYRQWLIEQKQFQTFKQKAQRTKQAERLVGATHIYLWGSDLLAIKDIQDWPLFIQRLKQPDEFARHLVSRFDTEAKKVLQASTRNPDRYQKRVLVDAVNQAVKYDARSSWQTSEPDVTNLASAYQSQIEQLKHSFTAALAADANQWGGGLSLATMDALHRAGLPRLWIGIGDGWEGGLWHSAAVSEAVRQGYLIAPYDSYQTALPQGFNPDWTTAHLGQKAYTTCSIVQEDGTLKAGFQQSGHYTDPRCIRPWLQRRISALSDAIGFNSWFLDAYATGMVFDNYAESSPMTQAENASENGHSMRWVAEKRSLVVGSEDGNAVSAQDTLFAHGMQTPVLGWGDKDLNNAKSPYYLGRWYPNHEPSIFFKSAPLKEPLRTIYFDPIYRLPLYQTVFHDSVVTSQHWLFDNLKLSNTLVDNQLAQLFYNVPALYNISEDTLIRRLPVIVAQDAFFRPLHQRLIDQSIVDFNWLSSDRRVQRITFSDGTTLLANFSATEFAGPAGSLPAKSVTAYDDAGLKTKIGRYVAAEDLLESALKK